MAFEPMHLPHESPGTRTGLVFALVVGFVAFVGLLMVLLALFFRWQVGSQTPTPFRTFPAPRLQPNPTQDYKALRAAQQHELQATYWIDRSRHIIHIPIERAMTYIAGQGAAGFEPPGLLQDQTAPKAAADGAARAEPHLVPSPYGQHP